jgi:hypothetical protein
MRRTNKKRNRPTVARVNVSGLTEFESTGLAATTVFQKPQFLPQTHCRAPSPDDPVRIFLFTSSCACFPKAMASKPFADRINRARNIRFTPRCTARYTAVYDRCTPVFTRSPSAMTP